MYYKKAFAFSITLWIIASLLFATVVVLRFAKDEVDLSRGLNSKLQTQMMAESVFESLKFYVPTADYTMNSLKNTLLDGTKYPLPNEIIVDGREYNVTKEITISLKDTSGMLNIMYDSSMIISKTLTTEKNDNLSYILNDSLEDWKDEDDMPRVNGAEQSNYVSKGKQIGVRNTVAIQDIHELNLVKGFEKIDFNHVESNLYYGRGTTINLMLTNNKRYLAFLLDVDENFILNLLELREESPLQFMKNLTSLPKYNDDSMGFSLSKQLIVKIKVQREDAETRLNAIISFKKLGDRPYLTISYSLY